MSQASWLFHKRTWLAVGLLAACVLSGLIYYSYLQFQHYLIQQTQRQLLGTAQATARGMDALIQEHLKTLQALLRDTGSRRQAFSGAALLAAYADAHEEILGVAVQDGGGRWSSRIGTLPQRPEPGYHPGPGGNGMPLWLLSQPLDGEGVLWLALGVDNLVRRFVAPIQPFGRGYAFLLDHNGVLVWHPNRQVIGSRMLERLRHLAPDSDLNALASLLAAMRAGGRGAGVYDFADWRRDARHQVLKIAAYSPVGTHLNLGVTVEYDAITTPLNRYTVTVSGLALTILAVFGVGAFLLYRLQQQTLERLRLAARVFADSQEGIMITDARGRLLEVNRAFSRLTGYDRREVLGSNPRLLSSGRHSETFYRELWKTVHDTGRWQGEIWNRRKDSEVYPEWLSISAVRDPEGRISHYIGIFSDLSEQKRSEARIHHLAYYDSLTQLPNRLLFRDRLRQALAHARRSGDCVGLLLLDLDRFKPINDSLGHPAGDRLLQAVAHRLLPALRETDTLARLGGDEFAIVLDDELRHPERAAAVAGHMAERILRRLEPSFDLDGDEVYITASIGVALFPQDGSSETELIGNADNAMYHAKTHGRNSYQFYSAPMNAAASQRLKLENALRKALENNEFTVYYQPQMDLQQGCVQSVEALLRWHHPALGAISPAEFIPLAEELGVINDIGAWVLHTACAQFVAWRQAGLPLSRVAVNLSARQFIQPDLPNLVEAALAEHGMDADWLELEITEGLLVDKSDDTLALLVDLKSLVGQLSIDDFGTGYSSLSYLGRLPVDALKIDQSFVREASYNSQAAAIVTAVISLARGLGLEVIAEGVETAEQEALLRRQGCRYLQGYLYGRPMTAQAIGRLLQQQTDPLRACCPARS